MSLTTGIQRSRHASVFISQQGVEYLRRQWQKDRWLQPEKHRPSAAPCSGDTSARWGTKGNRGDAVASASLVGVAFPRLKYVAALG